MMINNVNNELYFGETKIYGYIYKIENKINNKIYIGQSTILFKDRYSGGFANKTTNSELRRDAIKYGTINFDIDQCLDVALSKYELDKKEQHYIKIYDSYNNGYNKTIGGSGKKKIQNCKCEFIKSDYYYFDFQLTSSCLDNILTDKFINISHSAIVLYIFLYKKCHDNYKLGKVEFFDTEFNTYFCKVNYTSLMNAINISSRTTISKILCELQENKLIYIDTSHKTSNKYYIINQ